MVDADDFDVEGLRALLRGEAQPQQKPTATAPKTATTRKAQAAAPKKPRAAARAKAAPAKGTAGKAAPAKARATKQSSRTKKRGKR
ncbi:MAG TPA: hypothetical protein VI078_03370 [bacterium]